MIATLEMIARLLLMGAGAAITMIAFYALLMLFGALGTWIKTRLTLRH